MVLCYSMFMSTVAKAEAVHDSHGVETSVSVLDNRWAHDFSEAMAYAHGYQVDINLSDTLPTSATSLSLTDQKIAIYISRQLIEQAEATDQLDFLGFNILHELGHVKRYRHYAFQTPQAPKYAYFQNIVDDIVINFEVAKQTRFFADITKKAYDQYLFPRDKRAEIAGEPRHKQFMEGLLLLSMTTTAHRGKLSGDKLNDALASIGCEDLDETVVERLAKVVNFTNGRKGFNLLEQLRAHGSNLSYASQISGLIGVMYDELYEEDKQERVNKTGDNTSDGGGEPPDSEFDYSNSGGCQHTEQQHEHSTNKSTDGNNSEQNTGAQTYNQDSVGDEPNLENIGKQIGAQIVEVIDQAKSQVGSDEKPNQLSEEQLARLRHELDLNDSDFQGFLETVNKYRGEIAMVTDLILQLKRERQDNFLAPSHEISARGHRIHVGKLVGYVASGNTNPRPDIWKTPAFKEKVEYDFDGADFYFLCDTSSSMAGGKAEAAAESAVVLSQGIQDASFETYDDIPPIRIQVQAFGSGDETLCQLTDVPSGKDLGRMYSSLKSPNGNSTQVSGALRKVELDKSRLSIVLILSDGQFHDESAATTEGKRLEDEGAVLVQCVFGGASVSKLADSAKRMDIASARDLPVYIFGIMPALLAILRGTHNA